MKIISGILSMVVWFSSFGVYTYFMKHESRIFNPATGRIHELYNDGSIVYITSREYYSVFGMMWLAAALFLASAIFWRREKVDLDRATR